VSEESEEPQPVWADFTLLGLEFGEEGPTAEAVVAWLTAHAGTP